MTNLQVGKTYQIQARSADLGIGVVFQQDTVVEIRELMNDKVTFWSSQTGEEHTASKMGLAWVV